MEDDFDISTDNVEFFSQPYLFERHTPGSARALRSLGRGCVQDLISK